MTVGLCATCQHSRVVRGGRATFWLCGRSRDDPAFPRYPRLPVLRCRGYDAVAESAMAPAQLDTVVQRKDD